MVKVEIKRILKSKQFYIALLVGTMITSLEALSNNNIRLSSRDFVEFSSGVYNNLMIYTLGKYVRMLQMVFPIIVTMAFADSYLEDVKSGFIKNIITRYDKRKYLINRFFINFVVSGLIISIPLLINYMIYASFIPSIEPKVFFSSVVMEPHDFLPNIYFKTPFLHMIIRIFLLFVYGGTFSSIGLACSVFFRNKYVITIIPFIVYIAIDVVFFTILNYRYSPMMFLFSPSGYNNMFIAFPITITAISFSIFVVGGMKNEFD